MIGHFLLSLTPQEEERVLTTKMAGFPFAMASEARCLVQTVLDSASALTAVQERGFYRTSVVKHRGSRRRTPAWAKRGGAEEMCLSDVFNFFEDYRKYIPRSVAHQYDHLCWRFGSVVVNRCIRNRILSNRARRLLKKPAEVCV
jgi:hypothetical protein